MKEKDFSRLTVVAIEAALKAGEIVKQGFGKDFSVMSKPGKQNYVTEYDQKAENCIIDFIKGSFPTHNFLAEESGLSHLSADSIMWVIDPLDGTTNFVHQIPIVTVSIAAYDGQKGLSGVIYQPFTQELFIAEAGKGALLNGNRLSVSKTASVTDALLVGNLPLEDDPHSLIKIEDIVEFNLEGATFRNYGSAALTLAYLAAGKIDACWIYNLYPWDFAAGKILIEEAGGFFKHFDLDPAVPYSAAHIIASNRLLQKIFKE